MVTAFQTLTWDEAFREFLLHLQATRAANTVRYYEVQAGNLIKWAKQNDIPFTGFGKRHVDRYLVERARDGRSPMTLRHDAICIKAFFRWCVKYDLIERSPLAEYEIRNAPRPARYMPTDDEMRAMLTAAQAFWNPVEHPDARYNSHSKRIFHRDRNYAVLLGLLDTAARIGEMLSLKVDDYRAKERQITITESKGREPRIIPVSRDWAQSLEVWLKLRQKLMGNIPAHLDTGYLFVSEFGGRMDEGAFLKSLKRMLVWANLTNKITLHSLRRYSLNRLAKGNLLAAQQIAGHKETKTTILYTKLDADFVREVHDSVAVVRGILGSKRETRRHRIL